MDVGVIRVGVMGRNHARVYSELKEIGSTYVFDLDTKSAKGVATQTGAEVCSSIEELLRKVDLISLAIPTRFYFETAKQVIVIFTAHSEYKNLDPRTVKSLSSEDHPVVQ